MPPLSLSFLDYQVDVTETLLLAVGLGFLILIALFYLIGGPPRKFHRKVLDLMVAYMVIALFFGFMIGAYYVGGMVGYADAAVIVGLLLFWALIGLYKYLITPKHLRSKKMR